MYRIATLATLVVLFLASPLPASALYLSFNTTLFPSCYANSTSGCLLTDPTLWDNSTAPSPSDFLLISSTDPTPILLIFENGTLALDGLATSGLVTLLVSASAGLSIRNLTLDSGAELLVRDGSYVSDADYVALTAGSRLELANASFAQGTNATSFSVDGTSVVNASVRSSFILSSVARINSRLQLSADTTFTATEIHFHVPQVIPTSNLIFSSVYFTADANITNGLIASKLQINSSSTVSIYNNFIAPNITINPGSTLRLLNAQAVISTNSSMGSGNIIVHSSHLTLNNSYALPNSLLTFVGTSSLTVPTINLKDLRFDVDQNGAVANALIRATNGVQINDSVSIPGSLIAYNTFSQIVDATFNGYVQLVSCGSATLNGKLSSVNLFLNGSKLQPASGATLNSTNVYVGSTSVLANPSSISILGNLVNNGEVQVAASTPITISGAYTQAASAQLTLSKMTRNTTIPFLSLSGKATIAGKVSYPPFVVAIGETVKLPVLSAPGGISGKFDTPTVSFSSLSYENNNVYLIFSEGGSRTSDASKAGMLPWVFVLSVLLALTAL